MRSVVDRAPVTANRTGPRWLRRLVTVLSSLTVAGAVIVIGVQAAPAVTSAASIGLKPASGPPTTTVRIVGSGFGSREALQVDFGTTKKVATTTTSSSGTFSVAFTVPRSARPGRYPVTATGQASRRVATAKFLVRTNSPQFHFNAARTGVNPYENVISRSNVHRLVRAWTDSISNSVNSSPAVVDGVAYVSAGEGFYAFNASTGKRLWSDPGIFFDQSSPAVANGMAYAAAVDGHLYAFSTKVSRAHCSGTPVTCRPLWTAAIEGAGSVAQSSPTVVNGTVYVSAGFSFYAFRASGCSPAHTCKPLWTAAPIPNTGGESPVSGQSSPAVVGGVVYVGGLKGLYAYSATGRSNRCSGTPKTCTPVWTGEAARSGVTNADFSSSPAVANGVAYVGAGNDLFAFSTTCSGTCHPLWSFPTGQQIGSSPAVANGRVYIGSEDGKMYVLSASGHLLWSAATTAADSSSPAVANGLVYIASNHHIDAFSANGCSAATCKPLWVAPLTDSGFASPTVVNGMVYQGETANGQYLAAYKLG